MKLFFPVIQIVFWILSGSLGFSQSNWAWQNPSPTGNNLYNLQFTDLNTGYAVGFDFTILKTTNSGENWSLKHMDIDTIPPGLNGNLEAIYFINSLTGYVGRDGIFKTTNGGDTWSYHNTGAFVNSICFTSSDTGYAACDSGKIIKTVDGGNNWFLQYSIGNIAIHFHKIDFTSLNTGFVVGDFQTILKTTNQGNSWILKNQNLSIGSFFDFNFVNGTTGFAIGRYTSIVKTTNEGESWVSMNSIYDFFTGIYFVSQDMGYLVCASGNTYVTTDRGNQWSLLINLGIQIYKAAFINSNTGIVACEGGNIYKTTDSGIRWFKKIKYYTSSNILSISFVSDNVGFIAGSNSMILKTTNGGIEWLKIIAPANENFFYIKFFDNNNGYLAGNKLYRTSNSGLSWRKIAELNNIEDIEFYNLDTGYFLRNNDSLYKTFNGGKSWIRHDTEFGARKFFFMNNNDTGYFINSYYTIVPTHTYFNELYKTTNNGLNWQRIQTFQHIQYGGSFTSINFVNSETGFLSGIPGIKKTTNGGANWTSYPGLNGLTSELFFYNKNVGYVSTPNNMYKTTNSGNNWIQIFSMSKNVNAYSFTDVNTGYAIGQFGYILKTTNGGGINVNIPEENLDIPSTFNLYQNYPNPFNPVTKIKFDLPSYSNVKLIVYNILGKTVRSMVNTDLPAGTYANEFDGTNYPSGIYFYKLETEKFSQTKRMLLIK